MKKYLILSSLILSLLLTPGVKSFSGSSASANEVKPKLAIVIDDFGEDRSGVEEMLSLNIPLTVAVMPGCEFSKEDAEKAHALGHEVILHMPMENQSASTPASFYGPVVIKNHFSETEAVKTLTEALTTVPHAKGVNIHMGTGVSRNKKLMTAMMTELKTKDLYFLDSKTTEGTVCPECAEVVGIKFFSRDTFLEPPGRPNYHTALSQLEEALSLAKSNGKAIAIGHVGPVGRAETARAIKDFLPKIEASNVELVVLSKM